MIEMTLFFKCLHVRQLSNTMNGLRPYLKAVNLLKQWGSRNRILRCTSAGQCACQHACLSAFAREVTEGEKKSPLISFNGGEWLFCFLPPQSSFSASFFNLLRPPEETFIQTDEESSSAPFSSLVVARRPVKTETRSNKVLRLYSSTLGISLLHNNYTVLNWHFAFRLS